MNGDLLNGTQVTNFSKIVLLCELFISVCKRVVKSALYLIILVFIILV